MDNLFVLESSDNVVDSIDGINVRQESVSKTFTLTGSLDETSNISNGQLSQNLTLGLEDITKLIKSFIWDVNFGGIRVNSTEGIVLSWN